MCTSWLMHPREVFWVWFWQNWFFLCRIFVLSSHQISMRGIFVTRICFLGHFRGKNCEKIPRGNSSKIPGKILQNLKNKNPRHISADVPGQSFVENHRWSISSYSCMLQFQNSLQIVHFNATEIMNFPGRMDAICKLDPISRIPPPFAEVGTWNKVPFGRLEF